MLVMMVAFGSITTLIPRCDALGEGEATLALPPCASASRSLRRKQKDHRSIDNAAPKSPDIVSPLAAVVPPPVFSLAAASNSNRRMQSDESTSSTCLDTPNWEDRFADGCDWYERDREPGCPDTDRFAGDMGPATDNCCHCKGESVSSLLPTDSPTISHLPTKSATPSTPPTITNSPTKSATPSTSNSPSTSSSNSPSRSGSPTQTCLDNPNWKDKDGRGCSAYEVYDNCNDADADQYAGDMGTATEHCCGCGGTGIPTVSQNIWCEVRLMHCVSDSILVNLLFV